MSISASICRMCDQVSIEGHPEMVRCAACYFNFHTFCAVQNDDLVEDSERTIVEPEEDDEPDIVASSLCPICQGMAVLLEDARSLWGYIHGLEVGGVQYLTKEMCKPLVRYKSFGLDLQFIMGMEVEAAEMFATVHGSLRVDVEDKAILDILKWRLLETEDLDPTILHPASYTDVAN